MHKSILIISKKACEGSTELVWDWINSYGYTPMRLNGDDFETSQVVIQGPQQSHQEGFVLNGVLYPWHYYSIWYRRWSDLNPAFQDAVFAHSNISSKLAYNIVQYTNMETLTVAGHILSKLEAKKKLTKPYQIHANKLFNLEKAHISGLNVPKFLLTTRKEDAEAFRKECNNKVIVKAMNLSFSLIEAESSHTLYTTFVDEELFKEIPLTFKLTLFQEYIEKEYEIRTFFLHDRLFSMAIFSQGNERTKIDFRHYDFQNMSRMVPFKLPLK